MKSIKELEKEIERIENRPRVAGELTHPQTIPFLKAEITTLKEVLELIDKVFKEEFGENNPEAYIQKKLKQRITEERGTDK